MAKIFSLRLKILAALALLSGAAFFLGSSMTIEYMKRLGKYSVDACSALGRSVVNDSKSALMEKSREELQALALCQATLIDSQLKRIAGELELMAGLCARYLAAPGEARDDLALYFSAQKPARPGDYASCYLPGGVNLKLADGELRRFARLQPLLKFVNANNPASHIIYVSAPNGMFVSCPWTAQPSGYDPRVRNWYQAAVNSGGTVWVGPYISSAENKLIITCARAVLGFDGKIVAVCGIDIEVGAVLKKLVSTQLEPDCRLFILDSDGNVLAREGLRETGYSWEEEYKKENMLNSPLPDVCAVARRMTAGRAGCEVVTTPGQPSLLVAYQPVRANGWSIAIAAPEKKLVAAALKTGQSIQRDTLKHGIFIHAQLERGRLINAALGFLTLLLALVAVAWLSARITAPALALKKQVAEIGRGNLDLKIDLKTGDELERLANAFNFMTADLKRHIASLEKEVRSREKIEGELAASREIQASLLPAPDFRAPPQFELRTTTGQTQELGGEFHDYFMIGDATLFFCVGGVNGKGVPAALFMAMTKTLLAREAECAASPSLTLFNVNNMLAKDNDAGMSVAVFCGFLDAAAGAVSFGNAGHNRPLLRRRGERFVPVGAARGPAIGAVPVNDHAAWRTETLQLTPGDRLFFYSSAVTGVLNEAGQPFGLDNLLAALNAGGDAAADELLASLGEALRRHAGPAAPAGDVAMLCLSYRGG